MKLAWLVSPTVAESPAGREIARALRESGVDPAVFVGLEGEGDSASLVRLDGLRARHPRKELWRYELVLYSIDAEPASAFARGIFGEWPGIVLLRGIELDRDFVVRLVDRALALGVESEALAERLRREHPYAEVVAIDSTQPAALSDGLRELIARATARREGWPEPLLETAFAEIPGWLPG